MPRKQPVTLSAKEQMAVWLAKQDRAVDATVRAMKRRQAKADPEPIGPITRAHLAGIGVFQDMVVNGALRLAERVAYVEKCLKAGQQVECCDLVFDNDLKIVRRRIEDED